MFGTSIVQVVEQMNKKVDLTRLKKLPTVRVGHIFYYNAPSKKDKTLAVFKNKAQLEITRHLAKHRAKVQKKNLQLHCYRVFNIRKHLKIKQ